MRKKAPPKISRYFRTMVIRLSSPFEKSPNTGVKLRSSAVYRASSASTSCWAASRPLRNPLLRDSLDPLYEAGRTIDPVQSVVGTACQGSHVAERVIRREVQHIARNTMAERRVPVGL